MAFYGLEMAEKYITHKKDEKSPGYAGPANVFRDCAEDELRGKPCLRSS
jgi:hypothetical protein